MCLNVNNDYPGIKLSALRVKHLQIIFHGQFQLQVVNENPGTQPAGEEKNEDVITRLDILTRYNAAWSVKFHILSIIHG